MKNMKKNILAVLCTCFVASLALGVSAIAPVASADVETYTVETVQMREGATVRVGGEGKYLASGIRFSLLISKEYYESFENPVVGMYVVPAEKEIRDEETDEVLEIKKTTFEEMVSETTIPEYAVHVSTTDVTTLSGDIAETANDTYCFNAVVWGIELENYDRDLTANGYIAEGDGEKTFAENPQSYSVGQAASFALANGDVRKGLTGYVDGVIKDSNFAIYDVHMDKYKTATPSLGAEMPKGFKAIWSSSDENIVTVDDKGNLTFTGKDGEATITAKLGTKVAKATAKYGVPMVLSVNKSTAKNVYVYDGDQNLEFTYVDASSLGFTGDYTGGAASKAIVSSKGYEFKNPYSQQALSAIEKEGIYSHISLWFAVGGPAFTSEIVWVDEAPYYGGDSFMKKALPSGIVGFGTEGDTPLQANRWYKFTVSIDDYKDCCYQDFVQLMGVWDYDDGATNRTFYIGDIFFEKEELQGELAPSEILTVTMWNASNVYLDHWSGRQDFKYVEASHLGFAGDYQGGAAYKEFVYSRGYKIVNPYTKSKLWKIEKEGIFTKVSLWLAVGGDPLVSGSAGLYVDEASPENTHAFMKTAIENMGFRGFRPGELRVNTWYKFSLTIAEFKACCSEDYTYFNFMGAWDWVDGGDGKTFYVGNVFFE